MYLSGPALACRQVRTWVRCFTLDAPRVRLWAWGTITAGTAHARAITLAGGGGDELTAAAQALSRGNLAGLVAPAVRVERRVAVRAEDPQVLEPMVVAHAIDVVEHEAHPMALPQLALTTELADRMLEPRSEQPPLQMSATEGRPRDQDLFERSVGLRPRAGVRVEVGRGDVPDGGILAQDQVRAAGVTHAEAPKRFGPRHRGRDGLASCFLGVSRASWHDRTLVRSPDGNASWGARI